MIGLVDFDVCDLFVLVVLAGLSDFDVGRSDAFGEWDGRNVDVAVLVLVIAFSGVGFAV